MTPTPTGPGATNPEATAGDRELAKTISRGTPSGRVKFQGESPYRYFSVEEIEAKIAAHVAQRVAEAVAAEKGRRRMEAESYAARAGAGAPA